MLAGTINELIVKCWKHKPSQGIFNSTVFVTVSDCSSQSLFVISFLFTNFPYFRLRELNGGTLAGIIFQQDGARMHTARSVVNFLEETLTGEGAGIEVRHHTQRNDELSAAALRTLQLIETELARAGENVRRSRRIRTISQECNIEWAARSPDLNPLDFWLWGVLKHKCFFTPPRTAEEIMRRITEECRRIEREEFLTFERVR